MILLIILTLLLPFHESIEIKKDIDRHLINFIFIHYYDSLIYEEDTIIFDQYYFIDKMNNTIRTITDIKGISNVIVSYYFDILKVNIKLTFVYKFYYCQLAKEINIYEK